MKRVGAHVSSAGGVDKAPLNARDIGAKAFALFVKNQRQWAAPPLPPPQAEAFRRNCEEVGISARHILPHDSYLINLGDPEASGLKRSRAAFLDEARRCEALGLPLLNFHPGTHKGLEDDEACSRRVAESVNWTLERTAGVTAVIENTAGQGGCVGRTFEQIALILDLIEDKSRAGVCLDTCHLFASGYDLRTRSGYDEVMGLFGRTVGLGFLKAMHLNDSKSAFASRVDRHHSLGEGNLGWEPFRWIMEDPRLEEIPLILETVDPDRWPAEIAALYSFAGGG